MNIRFLSQNDTKRAETCKKPIQKLLVSRGASLLENIVFSLNSWTETDGFLHPSLSMIWAGFGFSKQLFP